MLTKVTTNPTDIAPELRDAFVRYERALMRNDVAELDALFADSPETIRSDRGTTLVGHVAIGAFRAGRSGAPLRELLRVHTRAIGDGAAVLVAESRRADGGLAVQTQVWERGPDGRWVVSTAHVSGDPAPATGESDETGDPAIWRIPPSNSPLAVGAPEGDLAHARIAVKDLFAVEGYPIGAGNPTWLRSAAPESENAGAVSALLAAGGDVVGIAQTDEFAFSLAGTNPHWGTPPNPAAPDRITGGSTSGPAVAVAAGFADVGLGTDTAGSIRVPASYCGLYGLRTTHGAVTRAGLLGLAPSFDTVGVLTRDADMLARSARALLPRQAEHAITDIVFAPELIALAEPEVQRAFAAALFALTVRDAPSGRELPAPTPCSLQFPEGADLDSVFTAFRTVQQAEAWRLHGEFASHHPEALGSETAARLQAGARVTAEAEARACALLDRTRELLRGALPPGRLLALPSTSSPAPLRGSNPESVERTRAATLRLTCLASLAGLPALSIPSALVGTLPVGICLIAGADEDRSLVRFAAGEGGPS
ncbi:DUF3225 domain-containing protein [Rhodococcus sp. WS4]|nr:DUF3225 domain-containing protein [Rhodococcus sp. WS4]